METFASKVKNAPLGKTHLFWVGQAGFIVKSATGKLLGIDLYLSECVEAVEGHDGYHRLMPKILDYDELVFDVLISTHFHRDHFDVDAMPTLMDNGHTNLFCAFDCMDDVNNLGLDRSRVRFVGVGDTAYIHGFELNFIDSDHGEGAPKEIAPIISVDGKNILEVGDTSLHIEWKNEYLKRGALDVLIAPINGAYGNLNETENVELARLLSPKLLVPCHFGMFASHGGNPGLWKDLLVDNCPTQLYKIFTMGEGVEI